ncbi:MAG: TIGR00730 family Rossman fold protein [Candidatus Ornithospirochaeta sp.]|nr:TIGR00730 family Rossman fold protein [Sphaerochaetaceae bacterium]MDY5523964.1 TIGR00730 family Rossman fold protein [Candidatus Ornithospirochaeta sp.]
MDKIEAIAVFCGSSHGKDEIYRKKAEELGKALALHGITLVYGGGNRGIMGTIAHSVHENGGKVIGVLPEAMIKDSVTKGAVQDELIVEKDMHTRKARMYSLSQGFIAMPGGIGTMEEILEIFTWRQLGYTKANVGLYNVGGYWDSFLDMLDKAVTEGFLSPEVRNALIVEDNPEILLGRMEKEETSLPDKLK